MKNPDSTHEILKINPLVHKHPATTATASEEHLAGVAQITRRMAGEPKTLVMDVAISNTIEIGSLAIGYVAKQIESREYDDIDTDDEHG